MERKLKNQKKTILVLLIACALLVAWVIFLQVRIKNVKAEEVADYEAQVAELTQERDEMQAAYDEKDYDATIDAMKDEISALKDEKAELLATPTPEPTEEPTAEPTEEPEATSTTES